MLRGCARNPDPRYMSESEVHHSYNGRLNDQRSACCFLKLAYVPRVQTYTSQTHASLVLVTLKTYTSQTHASTYTSQTHASLVLVTLNSLCSSDVLMLFAGLDCGPRACRRDGDVEDTGQNSPFVVWRENYVEQWVGSES